MLQRKLDYQSLKTVLLYMDANIRFQISLHMPSIRKIDKIVPLKINNLEFEDFCTSVNKTRYDFGIYRHYMSGNVPQRHKEDNERIGKWFDIDEFGFDVFPGSNILLPGDVSFKGENVREVREDTEETERRYRDRLTANEAALEILTVLESTGKTVNEYLQSLPPILEDEAGREEGRIRNALRQSVEEIHRLIDVDKAILQPFESRRNNTKPPFTCYLQLTIMKENCKRIQRFEYNKKLFEAIKSLNEILFGGRVCPIQVKRFTVTIIGIARLPIGFCMRPKRVDCLYNKITHKSFSVLLDNSESLDTLWINIFIMEDAAFQTPIVQNSKRLIFPAMATEALYRIISELPNFEISVIPTQSAYSPEDYYDLIHAWLSRERLIGSSFWMGLADDETGREVLKMVRTQTTLNSRRTKRCLTILLDDSVQIEIYYVPLKGTRPYYYEKKCNWMLKIRIVET